MAVCFCVDLSVCVSLQEAELAARILLDQGQVTAWDSPRVGGGALLSSRREKHPYLALLFASFPSISFLPHPHVSPFLLFCLLKVPQCSSIFHYSFPLSKIIFHCHIYLN